MVVVAAVPGIFTGRPVGILNKDELPVDVEADETVDKSKQQRVSKF